MQPTTLSGTLSTLSRMIRSWKDVFILACTVRREHTIKTRLLFIGIYTLILLLVPPLGATEVPPNCGDERIRWSQGERCDPPDEPCGRIAPF
jgi:hypothetical protein